MSGSVLAAAAGFLGRIGNQAAVSVAASAIAAAALAIPAGIGWPLFAGSAGEVDAPMAAASAPAIGADGKIHERHHDAGSAETPLRMADARGLVMPAAIVMPMALGWSLPAAEADAVAQAATAAANEPRQRFVQVQALPPRRPSAEQMPVVAENRPLVTAPASPIAASASSAGEAPRRGLLGLSASGPVARVGDAMTGAVGLVGAAGSWTLARASDLLPRL